MSPEAASLGIEEQVHELESIADPHTKAVALKLVASVLKLHATGLEQMMRIINESASDSESLLAAFQHDPLVRALLVLHDLTQQSPEVRVEQALQELEPQLVKLGARATVLHLDSQSVKITVSAGGQGCGSTAETVRSLVERTVVEAGPDIAEVDVRLEPSAPVLIPVSAIGPSPPNDNRVTDPTSRK
jgi:Fe-S cluster biogenesis protein NfuA